MGTSDSTRWSLIVGAARGNTADRERFAERYGSVVRAYLVARWRGTPCAGEVDDAIQEVFLDCFKDGGALLRADPSRPGGFRAFLFGIARNAARHVETRRARSREQQRGSSFDMPDDAPDHAAVFDRAWALSLVQQAGARHAEAAASDGDRGRRRVELLRLRFQDDLPIREIAKLWNEAPALLHREYARAREEFKRALLDVVAEHQPGSPGEARREAVRLLGLLK